MTTTAPTSSPFYFTSLDGTDENGVRAEVYVQTNKGTVKEIKENTAKEVADVHFSVENLKFPIHGWVRTDEPIYELIKTAQASGEEVTFRIESQRKKGVNRETPMADLRVDSNTARDNVKTILVGINGVLSSEALTSPQQDPKSASGRYVATEDDAKPSNGGSSTGTVSINIEEVLDSLKAAASNPQVRPTVLDALAAQALFHGATVDQVNEALVGNDKRDASVPNEAPRAAFSQEAPSWKKYNSDGRLNLGSAEVAAGVGIEALIYKQLNLSGLLNADNVNEVIEYFSDLIFTISDRVQIATYGDGFRADRAASSHVRIRGIVYDTIDKTYNLPVSINGNLIVANGGQAALTSWLTSVGKESIARFSRAIRSSQEIKTFNQVVPPASLVGGSSSAPAQARPEAPVSAVEAPAESVAPVVTPEVAEPAEAVVEAVVETVETPAAPKKARANKKAAPVEESASPSEPSLDDVASESVIEPSMEGVMLPRLLTKEDVDGAELSTDESRGFLKELFEESGFDINNKADLVRISHLLGYTFGEGFSNAKNIPDEHLLDFIDWYSGNGSEALHSAVKVATGRK